MTSNHAIASAVLVMVLGLAAGPAAARQWQATPTALATEYIGIIDQRSANEIVIVMWMAPEIVEDTAENAAARKILSDYVVIGVVRATISNQGVFTYAPPSEVLVSVQGGAARGPLADDAMAPVTVAVLAAMQSMMEQALGPMGEGMQWFAFDGDGIESCGKGEFWVAYAGENYNYETPIPGCPAR